MEQIMQMLQNIQMELVQMRAENQQLKSELHQIKNLAKLSALNLSNEEKLAILNDYNSNETRVQQHEENIHAFH